MPRQTLTKRADGATPANMKAVSFMVKQPRRRFASVMITSACRNEDITWA